MENNTRRYIEIAIGSVSNRGIAIDPNQLYKYLKPEQELYRSMFLLDSDAFDHFRDQKTIRSYKGKFALDRLIFDVDKGKNSGQDTINRANNIVKQLLEMGCPYEYVRVWFSGRGFHIDIPDLYGFEPSESLPSIVKQTIAKDFGNAVDNIYDRGRLIRVGHSYNLKSQLYKIPIETEELDIITYDEVKELALSQKRTNGYSHDVVDNWVPIWNDRIEKPKEVIISESLPTKSKYNANVTCVQKMWDYDKSGRRHIMLLRMVNAWRRMGITKDMSKTGAAHNVDSLAATEVYRLVDDVYSWEHQGYGCNDIIMEEFCDPVCKYFKQKNYGTDIFTSGELSNRFREFIQTDFSESSFNLKDIYSIPSDYRFMPGELCILLGDTKLGKTAFVQNLLVPLKSMRILFLSLEVNEWMIFRRFAQVANKMTKAEINEIYKSNNEEMISTIERSIEHINISTTPPNIDSIKEIVCDMQPDIVVIDTVDAIDVQFENNPLMKMDKVINGLKAIANEKNMIFFGISHISKHASNEMLNVHSAKGSSAIEQKADKIIGIMGDRDVTAKRVIRSLASRDEDGFELACMFDHNTFQFKEMQC